MTTQTGNYYLNGYTVLENAQGEWNILSTSKLVIDTAMTLASAFSIIETWQRLDPWTGLSQRDHRSI